MARLIVAQLYRRAGRATALLLGVLLATTGFTVLTGSTATSQLAVRGEVNAHSRGAYDILVRPKGARTALEAQRGLVRANFLAGHYAGITEDQWHDVAAVNGVEVAAPIAMIGYASTTMSLAVDVTDAVDRTLETQLIRVTFNWRGDRGLTSAADPDPALVYVTKRRVLNPRHPSAQGEPDLYDDGQPHPNAGCNPAGQHEFKPILEVQTDGNALPICLPRGSGTLLDGSRATSVVVQLTPQGAFLQDWKTSPPTPSPRLVAQLRVPLALLTAAIDPPSEAALVGLDKALVNGRYLAPNEPAAEPLPSAALGVYVPDPGLHWVPVVMANETYLDESVDTIVDRVEGLTLGGKPAEEIDRLAREAGAAARQPVRSDPLKGHYRDTLDRFEPRSASGRAIGADLSHVMQPGPASYDILPDGTLRPRDVPNAASAWAAQSHKDEDGNEDEDAWTGFMPWLSQDTAQRPSVPPTDAAPKAVFGASPVGVFDPSKLSTGDSLATTVDTYAQASAAGADERSRDLLGGQPLLPTSNLGGYLATSPTVLMALATYWETGGRSDAIGAIRVRVAGVTGFDALSRERVRLAADDIARITGLDVEVMLGASPAPQTIELGAGRFGRPQLRLDEPWSKKGVAAAIVQAVDRKSVVLFGLILVVCLLFLANAAAAAVRDRQRELAILSCLGWPRRRLAGLIIGEVAVIGLIAGLIGALLARLVGALIQVDVSAGRAWLSLPVAIGLCVVAGLVPAWRASVAHPAGAVHRASSGPGRRGGRPRRRVVGLALANLRRAPGRTALGAIALAVGIAGLTLVAGITWAFHGSITGTMLGDAITVRVRGVDLVAVVAIVAIGAAAVADVLYLNVRDRAAELAALHATGWSGAALSRLITYEGLGIGVIGAVIGAAAGLGLATLLVDTVPDALLWTAGATAGGGVLVAAAAAAVPAALQRRMPISIMLAEE